MRGTERNLGAQLYGLGREITADRLLKTFDMIRLGAAENASQLLGSGTQPCCKLPQLGSKKLVTKTSQRGNRKVLTDSGVEKQQLRLLKETRNSWRP